MCSYVSHAPAVAVHRMTAWGLEPGLPNEKETIMRRVLLKLAAVAVVALATQTASAAGGYRGYGGYPATSGYYYGGYWSPPIRYSPSPHDEAVRRIRASHSRYRYFTHPRSLYNSPPSPYDYWGW